MRTFLLLASMACFFLALVHARRWDLLWIDHHHDAIKNMHSWMAGGGITFAASFLPWSVRPTYWFAKGNQ